MELELRNRSGVIKAANKYGYKRKFINIRRERSIMPLDHAFLGLKRGCCEPSFCTFATHSYLRQRKKGDPGDWVFRKRDHLHWPLTPSHARTNAVSRSLRGVSSTISPKIATRGVYNLPILYITPDQLSTTKSASRATFYDFRHMTHLL
jgi:hypothetical protein